MLIKALQKYYQILFYFIFFKWLCVNLTFAFISSYYDRKSVLSDVPLFSKLNTAIFIPISITYNRWTSIKTTFKFLQTV